MPSFTLHYFPDPPERGYAYFVAVSPARSPAPAVATIVPLTPDPMLAQGDCWTFTSLGEEDAIQKAKHHLNQRHPAMRCVETPIPQTLVPQIARLLQGPTASSSP